MTIYAIQKQWFTNGDSLYTDWWENDGDTDPYFVSCSETEIAKHVDGLNKSLREKEIAKILKRIAEYRDFVVTYLKSQKIYDDMTVEQRAIFFLSLQGERMVDNAYHNAIPPYRDMIAMEERKIQSLAEQIDMIELGDEAAQRYVGTCYSYYEVTLTDLKNVSG